MKNEIVISSSGITSGVEILVDGMIQEVFDNLVGTLSNPGLIWQNLVSAVNNGQPLVRGPSRFVVASLSTGVGSAISISGGIQYEAGDILTIVGGTFSEAAQIYVNGELGGAINAWAVFRSGQYSVFPTGTRSVTGGTGRLATFTVTQGTQFVPKQQNILLSGGTDGNLPTASFAAIMNIQEAPAYSLPGAYLTALEAGTNGNNITATISKGSNYSENLPTFKLTISYFDNVPLKKKFTFPTSGTGYLTANLPTSSNNIAKYSNVGGQIVDSGVLLSDVILKSNLFAITVSSVGGFNNTINVPILNAGITSDSIAFCNLANNIVGSKVYRCSCTTDNVAIVFDVNPGLCKINLLICISPI